MNTKPEGDTSDEEPNLGWSSPDFGQNLANGTDPTEDLGAGLLDFDGNGCQRRMGDTETRKGTPSRLLPGPH
jgi:hypothetical protein